MQLYLEEIARWEDDGGPVGDPPFWWLDCTIAYGYAVICDPKRVIAVTLVP